MSLSSEAFAGEGVVLSRRDREAAVAFRGLRPRSQLGQLVLVIAAEAVALAAYRDHDSAFHWATHFLVAVVAASVWGSVHLLVLGRPSPWLVAAVLPLHTVAMLPDVLFALGVPHARWMDVFLLHISAHYLPGGDLGWLLLAATSMLACTGLVAAWSHARREEMFHGMAPGVGFGGAALVRPQLSPDTPLTCKAAGQAPPQVVLVHGLGGAASTWQLVQEQLAGAGVGSVAVDLPGHGRSLRLGTSYALADQAVALLRFLDGVPHPVVLVGHSYGAAVTAAVARLAPDAVGHLVLVTPPAFRATGEARAALSTAGWLARATLDERLSAAVVCGAMCLGRRPMTAAAGLLDRTVPRQVARDATQHNYPAYRDGIFTLLHANPLPLALADPPVPTTVLLGKTDRMAPMSLLALPRAAAVLVAEVDGGHRLPLSRPGEVASFIAAAYRALATPPR